METGVNYGQLYQQLKQEAGLEIDYAKLTITEKLVKILSAIAILLILLFVASSLLVIISLSAIHSLESLLNGNIWAAVGIVLGALLLLFGILWSYRKQLIVNPISRYFSKLILDAPSQQ